MSDILKIQDPVFGNMEYIHYWRKNEEINFWNRDIQVIIAAKTYRQRPITKEQRTSYQYFEKNRKMIEKRSKAMLEKYMMDNDVILQEENIPDLETVLFTKTGEIILLFTCKWEPEHGFAIQVYPKYKMGTQDLFL